MSKSFNYKKIDMIRCHAYRDVVIASISLTTLCAFPVFVPNVMAQMHVAVDLLETLFLGRAIF